MREVTEIKKFIEHRFKKTEKICKDLRKRNNLLQVLNSVHFTKNLRYQEEIKSLHIENKYLKKLLKQEKIQYNETG
jgi:hypothetical protein